MSCERTIFSLVCVIDFDVEFVTDLSVTYTCETEEGKFSLDNLR